MMNSTAASADLTDYNAGTLAAWWAAEFPRNEDIDKLRTVFLDAVAYGVQRPIQGVRDCDDPSVNDDMSPTLLVFLDTDAKAGITILRPETWEPFMKPNSEIWDKFSEKIYNRKWFQGETAAERLQVPAHVAYGWNRFQGASVTVTEFSYNKHGFPEHVHWKSRQRGRFITGERPKPMESRPVQPQPAWGKEIFGRSWYTGVWQENPMRRY
jgi:hypothetical protein